ncbi:STAS domain-containing protein [Actinacidiphila alni]|uniref:Anti-sigma factor antagonist n=1 Tax=Actinacidiphila alni TaxID=380248 RepID=A0A1I2C0M2_9ACTN|nr:STAS domain-containing protein [Actinacidiphila alni]SFE61110.1 anti-sigma B factor antagonist [Actinacidiphila alni]
MGRGGDDSARPVEVAVRRSGGAMVLAVRGELDLDSFEPLRAALSEAVRQDASLVVVDMSQVTFCDSSTMNVLLRADADLGPGRLRIAAPSPFVARLFGLVGLQMVLPLRDTVEEALAGSEDLA